MKRLRIPLLRHRFELTGLNLERFINASQKAGIPLLRVWRQDARSLLCECFSCDLAALSSMAEDKGWRVRGARPLALSAFLSFLKKRPGIPAGLLLGVITAVALSQFVWRIEIHNAGAYQADIASYLAESGFSAGMRKQEMDAQALVQALTLRYPEVAWFHVYVSNVTLVVDVTHGTSMPKLPAQKTGDVIAARDGVVASIRVFSGTAAVKAGDTVRKGQILIRGEERGADGERLPVRAQGVVMARCWLTQTVQLPLYEISSAETGRETFQTRIITPWFSFPAAWESPDFLAYHTYLTDFPLVDCFFPVQYQKVLHKEVALEYVRRNPQEVKNEAADAALKQLGNALYGYEIIDKWVDYCMIEDESLSASATAEWLMDIGGYDPP